MHRMKVVDLFAGLGGFSAGAIAAGAEVILGVDLSIKKRGCAGVIVTPNALQRRETPRASRKSPRHRSAPLCAKRARVPGARAGPLLRQLAEALHDRLAHEARGREPARLVRVHEEAQLAPHRLRGRRQRSGVARSQRVEEQVVATTARSRAPRARPHAL